MAEGIRDRTAIVGMAQTPFGKGLEDTELSLACQAISAAIDETLAAAGVPPERIARLPNGVDTERFRPATG